jgi:hypothetical protein
MNPFVDTQKRSVELPFGCKDLADALAKRNQEPDSKARWKLLNGLQETERYLAGLLLPPAALSFLSIDIPDMPHRLELMQVRDELCILLSIDCTEKGQLPRIRKFFQDAGIASIVDVMGSFSVLSETSTRILIYPLPVPARDAAELITRVLQEGLATVEDAQLYISSNEKTIA